MAKKKAKSDRLAGPIGHARAVPIGDYGFLSDGEVSALVAPGGSVDWMCVPRFDSPSVFGAILGRRAGTFRVAPVDVTVPADRRYLPGHDDPGDQLGHRHRLDHRARRAADRSLAPPGRPLADLPPHAQRLRGRAHPAAHHPLRVRRGADDHGLRAGARLRPRARPLGVHGRELPPGPGERRGHRRHADPHHRHAAGLRRRPGQHPHPAQGGRRPLRRPVLGRRRAAHRPTTTPTSGRCGPPTTGSTGWRAASSPTTRGAATCSAARSR